MGKADLEFRKVQEEPPLYDLYIAGELRGSGLTLDEVILQISTPAEKEETGCGKRFWPEDHV